MILPILRRAALVALREIANGCADSLDEPRASDRLRAFEARVDAFADVLREVAATAETARMSTDEKYRPSRESFCVSLMISDVDRMIEALSDEVQP